MIKLNGFYLKNLQTMEGHEGLIMRGSLWYGSSKIADFFDDGNGGPMMVSPIEKDFYKKSMEKIKEILSKYNIVDEKTSDSDVIAIFVEEIINLTNNVSSTKKWAKKNEVKNPAIGIAVWKYKGSFPYNVFQYIGAINVDGARKYLEKGDEMMDFDRLVLVETINTSDRNFVFNV